MTRLSGGTAWGNWLVSKTSGMLDAKLSRRSFIARTTLLGTAVAATGCAVVTQPGSPYTRVTDCSGGLCTDGYTEFCCVINEGVNACPPNSFPGGWWRATGSIYCLTGTRYYIDCMQDCCGPNQGDGFCASCLPCRCAVNCNTRKVYCNYFRYGQCMEEIGITGPIACRVVTCTPPYDLNIGCSASDAVDNATANHNADCAAYTPPPPPPPPPPAVMPASASAIAVGGLPVVASRGSDGAAYANSFNGTGWSGWLPLGGDVTSRVVLAGLGSAWWAVTRGGDDAVWVQTATSGTWGGWQSLGGSASSDPAVVVDSAGTLWVFVRGFDDALWVQSATGGTWGGWQSLGGNVTSDPAAAIDASGNLWVAVRSGANAVYVISRSAGGSWGTWSGLGGTATSDPAIVATGNGTVWVFARGVDDALWLQSSSGGTWGGWQSLGGSLDDDPAAASGTTLWVFAVSEDQAMYCRELNAGAWSAWASLSGSFAPVRGATS